MKSYKRISLSERIAIASYLKIGKSVSDIAILLNRNKSSISREINRYPYSYEGEKANKLAQKQAGLRHTGKKLDKNKRLYNLVYSCLKKHWSPNQIAVYLKSCYPKKQSMQISAESIYTYLYLLPRGSLKKELINYLRQKKKSRYSRKGSRDRRGKISDMISIEERPKEVANRSVAGHWEGDLIMGKRHQTAIGTIVERKTRTVILVPLKSKDAVSVRKAFEKEFKKIPSQMRKTLTYDQGREMAEHKLFTKNTKVKVFFCNPASPWERGTNENTNMLIRDYFPKGTDFSKVTRKELKHVQRELNERPRKTLNWRTPIEVFEEEVLKKSPVL